MEITHEEILTPEQQAMLDKAEEGASSVKTKAERRAEKKMSITDRMKLIYERERKRSS